MKRSRSLKIALSESEYEVLSGQAGEAGISMAGVVRCAVLKLPLPKRRTNVEIEAVAALNRIGGNLNQLVRVAKVEKLLTAPQIAAVGGVLKKIDALSRQIREGMDRE
jgi:hypothetical protein